MAIEVKVGDRHVTVAPFNGRKAIIAGGAVRSITHKAPDLQKRVAEFAREYSEQFAQRITRDMVLAIPFWQERLGHLSDGDWEQRGNVLTLPATPETRDLFFAVFPHLMDVAETDVLRLLALIVIPNSELAGAAREGSVDDALSKEADRLLDDATVGQLAELAVAAVDVVQEEFNDRSRPLMRLRELILGQPDSPPSSESRSTQQPTSDELEHEEPETSSMSETKKKRSSTASPKRTDGPRKSRSTRSPGEPSAASAAA
jgi:hypothetical protein